MREPSGSMPPFDSGRDFPAIVSEKSLSPTVDPTNGSLGVSTTSLAVRARAERIRGAVMSAGTSAVADHSEVPPLAGVGGAEILPPAGGSAESGKLKAPAVDTVPEPTQFVAVAPSGSP